MRLSRVIVRNYKSIEGISFPLDFKLKEQTYTLVGINEAGKSSFLEAISFYKQENKIVEDKFFNFANKNKAIEIIFEYNLSLQDKKDFNLALKEKGIDDNLIKKFKFDRVSISRIFNKGTVGVILEKIALENEVVLFNKISKAEDGVETKEEQEVNLAEIYDKNVKNFFYEKSHNVLFWKSTKEYLLNEPVDLVIFSNNPSSSVPLKNCFNIIGIKDEEIKRTVDSIIVTANSRERKDIVDRLDKKITEHINNVWKEHKIKIKFDIHNNILNFLVEDDGVEFENKETSQRSDGFREFVSFLLTTSAQNSTGELSNFLLLIDEPEQHLHPKAAESFRDELIKITSESSKNNIIFFATHSIFMIDEINLKRCYRVEKENNKKTIIRNIEDDTSYSSLIYNVFEIYTNDLHNELYGWIQDEKQIWKPTDFDTYLSKNGFNQNKKYEEVKNGKTSALYNCTLATYIRHQIHHPENNKNMRFERKNLKESIEKLIDLKGKIKEGKDNEI